MNLEWMRNNNWLSSSNTFCFRAFAFSISIYFWRFDVCFFLQKKRVQIKNTKQKLFISLLLNPKSCLWPKRIIRRKSEDRGFDPLLSQSNINGCVAQWIRRQTSTPFFLLARGVVVGLSFAGLKFILAARLWLLLISFFFPSEQTFFSSRFQNKFRENPSSPSAVRVQWWYTIYNTHTHSINNTTTTTTCRTTKVAVPLLMSTSTTIYSPVQTCVLFNVIVSRVNSRFCSCCVC